MNKTLALALAFLAGITIGMAATTFSQSVGSTGLSVGPDGKVVFWDYSGGGAPIPLPGVGFSKSAAGLRLQTDEVVINSGNSLIMRATDGVTWMHQRVTKAGIATYVPFTPEQAQSKGLP